MLHVADTILSPEDVDEMELDFEELSYADRILQAVSLAFDDDDWNDNNDDDDDYFLDGDEEDEDDDDDWSDDDDDWDDGDDEW